MSPWSAVGDPGLASCKAILGGTFDPIHLGHLHAARIGRRVLNTATVTLLLAARPWHRAPPVASIEHRWRMLRLAADTETWLLPSDRQITQPGPSYTVDTLIELAGTQPLVWFIGRDAVDAIESWRRIDELPALCHLLVFDRPGGARKPRSPPRGFELVDDAAELAARSSGGVYYVEADMLDVSSTQVRRVIAEQSDASALLPRRVWSYIRRHGLYGARAP